MTVALWAIFAILAILVGLRALVFWIDYVDTGDLDVLTEDDVRRATRPEVDRLLILAADDTPQPANPDLN